MAIGIRHSRTGSSGSVPLSQTAKDEVYALSGLNMVTPDQIIDLATRRFNRQFLGQSPYTINSRMLARDTNEQRVAIRTRKGSSMLFSKDKSTIETPLVVASASSISAGEIMFSSTQQAASPISVPVYFLKYGLYSLHYMDLYVRKDPGYIESVQIRYWSDNAGLPGQLVAETSINPANLATGHSKQTVYLMDAPDVSSNQKLWMTMDVIGDTAVKCYVQTSAAQGGLYRDSTSASNPWFPTHSSAIYATQLYRSGSVMNAFRRNVPNEIPTTLVATGYGDVISFADDGTEKIVYPYSSSYEDYGNKFRFLQSATLTIISNGVIQPQQYNGTTVTPLSAAPVGGKDFLMWQGQVICHVGNRFSFTNFIYVNSDVNVWPSVNFFYPNNPLDPDQVVGVAIMKNELFIFTQRTKYRATMNPVVGKDSLNIVEVTGTKGGVSQDTIAVHGDLIYFLSSDKQIYTFNGSQDSPQPLSNNVQPEIQSAQNPQLLSHLTVINNEVRYYYAKSPNTTTNHMLLFDLVYGEWFFDTDRNVSFSITYPLEGSPLIEFSSQTTMAFLGNQNYDDCGKPIDFKYWTNYKAYGSGAAKKRIKRFRPILKISGRRFTMRVGKDMDFSNNPDMRPYIVNGGMTTYGEGAQYGDGISKYGGEPLVDSLSGMSGRGKHIQYRFEKRGVNTPVELYGYIALFREGTNK